MRKSNTMNKLRKIIKEEVRRALKEAPSNKIISFDEWDAQTILDRLAKYYNYVLLSSDDPKAIESCGLDSGYHFECQADIDLSREPYMATVSGIDKEGDYKEVGDIPVADLDNSGQWEMIDYTKM